ncbi:MAG: EamA family transporter [Bdellovibrionales bacterium]|nr:EamA family transporter [Bdellovibrionales bacterium]
MSGETFAIIAVLLAAVLHAGWNTLVKTSRSSFLTIAMLQLLLALAVVPLVPLVAPPDRASWPYLGLSVLIHLAYQVFLSLALRHGDLSLAYPIARGSGPVFVTLFAPMAVDEPLTQQGVGGIVAIFIGICLVAFKPGIEFSQVRRGVVYAVATGALIAMYTVADGMGARVSGAVGGYIVWLYLLEGAAIGLLAFLVQPRQLIEHARMHWRRAAAGAAMAGGAYGIVIWALTESEMAYIAALRESSVVFAALIGALFLHEPFGHRRVIGSAIVSGGIVVLSL